MVQTLPTPFEVGRAFVHQYYTLLHQAPDLLHRFYSTDSTFVHGGVDRPESAEQPVVGPENISKRIKELNLRECHAKIRQVDSHPTIGNGVVVQVTGELSNNGNVMRRFMQTFVLAPRQPKKYYVQNDIFRYQDEVFDDGSDDDDRSSSHVYGDTDKVSDADSSVAVIQQPPIISVTVRVPVEEQHQPLPPRRTGETIASQQQRSVTPDSTIRAQETTVIIPIEQQLSKQTTTEGGASYAGIAKLNSSTGPVANPTIVNVSSTPVSVPPVPPVTSGRSMNRTNHFQRSNTDYHRQNNRTHQWIDHPQQEYRPSVNQFTAPNEQQVFVGSLPVDFTREALVDCFSQYGHVLDVKLNSPMNENKKNFGFVIFDDPIVASMVVQKQHVTYNNIRLNVEPKTQKSFSGNQNNGLQGNPRHNNHNNYQNRGTRGGRPPYRNNGNNSRRGGGSYRRDAPFFNAPEDENKQVPQQS